MINTRGNVLIAIYIVGYLILHSVPEKSDENFLKIWEEKKVLEIAYTCGSHVYCVNYIIYYLEYGFLIWLNM